MYKVKLRIIFYIFLLKTLFNIFKQKNSQKILDNKKEIYKKNYDVVFITHLVNEKQFDSTVDNYFGDLINYISKKGLSVLLIFIPHIKSNKKEFIKYLKKRKDMILTYLMKIIINFKEKLKTIISLLEGKAKVS